MDWVQAVQLALFIFFNPFIVVAYLACSEQVFPAWAVRGFESTGRNSSRLRLLPYSVFCLIAALLGLTWQFWLGRNLAHGEFAFRDLLIFESSIWLMVSHGLMALALMAWRNRQGIELNLFGFIFFPLVLVSAGVWFVRHLVWLWQLVNGGAP